MTVANARPQKDGAPGDNFLKSCLRMLKRAPPDSTDTLDFQILENLKY